MVSNVLLRSSGHLNPRFLVILAMAVVALTAVGCGGNVHRPGSKHGHSSSIHQRSAELHAAQ